MSQVPEGGVDLTDEQVLEEWVPDGFIGISVERDAVGRAHRSGAAATGFRRVATPGISTSTLPSRASELPRIYSPRLPTSSRGSARPCGPGTATCARPGPRRPHRRTRRVMNARTDDGQQTTDPHGDLLSVGCCLLSAIST